MTLPFRPVLLAILALFTGAGEVAGEFLKPVLDRPLQDVAICRGADAWYLTGTLPSSRDPADFANNDGIEVWRSTDMAAWTSIGQVWNIERDAPASPASAWQLVRRPGGRGITAPEIHFLKDTYWIPYAMNGWGTGLLKSRTGKPEGPYEDLGRFTAQGGGDPSLFQDDDGTVYWLWGAALIAPLKPDLSGLAGPPVSLLPSMHSSEPFSFLRSFILHTRVSGAFLCKVRGTYQLSFASWANRLGSPCHDTLITTAKQVLGPYQRPMMFTNHTGQVTVFPSGTDAYAASCWGADDFAVHPNRAAVLPLAWDDRNQTLMRVRLDAWTEKGPWDRLTPIQVKGGADPEILYAPNGWYYYTASAQVDGRLLVFRSRDLATWEELTVTTADQVVADPLWPVEPVDPKDKRPPAAPAKLKFWEGSILWHQDRLWIASGLMGVQAPGGRKAGLGLWCSPKDGADGPFTSRGRIASNDGVSLFADDDGSAYLCTGFGLLRKFKPDMSGLDEAWGRYTLAWAQGIQVNYDCGWFLSKIGGKYIAQAIQVQGAYCSTYGIADSLKGPYRYIGVSHPHGGNSKLSQTKDGGWMQILFGNTDYYVPFEMSQGPRITSMVVDTSGGTVRIRME